MSRAIGSASIVLGLAVAVGARVAEGGFVAVDFSGHHNARMQDFGTADGVASEYPEGQVTLGGVPFAIPEGGFNTWSAASATDGGDDPVAVDIGVGIFGVEVVHLLLTTHKGEQEPGTFASLEFFGSDGAYYAKPLNGDDDIRDWLFSEYTNTINGATTVEVFAAGSGYQTSYRLDMLTVDLPPEFGTQALEAVRVSDWGRFELQRVNVHGITVTAIPEPSSLVGALAGAVVAGGWQLKRWRKAA